MADPKRKERVAGHKNGDRGFPEEWRCAKFYGRELAKGIEAPLHRSCGVLGRLLPIRRGHGNGSGRQLFRHHGLCRSCRRICSFLRGIPVDR